MLELHLIIQLHLVISLHLEFIFLLFLLMSTYHLHMTTAVQARGGVGHDSTAHTTLSLVRGGLLLSQVLIILSLLLRPVVKTTSIVLFIVSKLV